MWRVIMIAGLIIGGLLGTVHEAAAASDNTGTFTWIIGNVGPVPVEGPDISMAADGSTLTITGFGQFTIGRGRKSISGGGDYTLKDAGGQVVDSGQWRMTRLGGYVDYGGDPAALELRGGTLTAQVRLNGLGAGRIWIYCLLGSPPPTKHEGIRVDIGSRHFMPHHGETLFIRQ